MLEDVDSPQDKLWRKEMQIKDWMQRPSTAEGSYSTLPCEAPLIVIYQC